MHVTAVIVTYGDRHNYCVRVVDRCLAEGVDKILLLENGVSSSAQAVYARKAIDTSKVQVVNLGANRGSAGGIAAGVELLRDQGLEGMVLFLDDDNLLCQGAVDTLKETYFATDNPDVRDPVLFCSRADEFPDDALALETGIPKRVKKNAFMGFDVADALRKRWIKNKQYTHGSSNLVAVDHGPWGGMFISMERLRTAEAIQADFYLYGDDLWFTHNLALEGVPMKLVGEASISDLASTYEGVTSFFSPDLPDLKAYYALRNYTYTSKHWATSKWLLRLNRFVFLSYQLGRELRVSWRRCPDILRRAGLIRAALNDGRAGRLGVSDLVAGDKTA